MLLFWKMENKNRKHMKTRMKNQTDHKKETETINNKMNSSIKWKSTPSGCLHISKWRREKRSCNSRICPWDGTGNTSLRKLNEVLKIISISKRSQFDIKNFSVKFIPKVNFKKSEALKNIIITKINKGGAIDNGCRRLHQESQSNYQNLNIVPTEMPTEKSIFYQLL